MSKFKKKADNNFAQQHTVAAPLLASVGVDLGTKLLNTAYGAIPGVFSRSKNTALRGQEDKLHRIFERIAELNGYKVSIRQPGAFNPASAAGAAIIPKYFKHRFSGTAVFPREASPAILAHELGHIKQPSILNRVRAPAMYGAIIPNISSLFNSTDKDTAKRDALISSGMIAGGLLPSEIDASIRGYNTLSRINNKRPMEALSLLRRLRTFAGLPSYALAAAAPFLTYKLREGMGTFDPKK